MKHRFSSLLTGFIIGAASAQADEAATPSDDVLIQFTKDRTNAVRITQRPVRMSDKVSLLCVSPPAAESRIVKKGLSLESQHRNKYAHVYVSQNGEQAMRTVAMAFPEGTIILKEKFADAEGHDTELFTGMIKREKGYNPECGDWEFFTQSGDAGKITARGKLRGCMDCHVEYEDSDYVTKNYVRYSQ